MSDDAVVDLESECERFRRQIELRLGASVFLSVKKESDAFPLDSEILLELRRLERTTLDLGAQLCVRREVLGRYLNGVGRGDDEHRHEALVARRCLADVWAAAIQRGPTALGLSLSHSHGLCAAAARIDGAEPAIGLDIERVGRTVSAPVLRRISHAEDSWNGCPPLGRWTLKEAVLKADLRTVAPVLPEYWIQLSTPFYHIWTGQAEDRTGGRYRVALTMGTHAAVAVALVESEDAR